MFSLVTLPLSRRPVAYLIVLPMMAVALWIRLLVAPVEAGLQYLTFFPAVALSAIIGGLGPGLFSVGIGMVLATVIFVPPYYSLSFTAITTSLWANSIFMLDGIVVSLAIHAMHQHKQGQLRNLAELEAAQTRLLRTQSEPNLAQTLGRMGSWYMDGHGGVLHFSEEACLMFGLSGGRALTFDSFLSYVHPEDRRDVRGRWDAALQGEPFDTDYRLIRGDEVLHVRGKASFQFDKHGKLMWGLGTVQDVSERRGRELEYRQIIETTRDGFWLCDGSGRILDVNSSYCRMVGYSKDEVLHKKISNFEAIESPIETKEHIKRIAERGFDNFETRHRCKDGHLIDLEISVSASESRPGVMVAFVRDISQRIQHEQARLAEMAANRDLLIREVHHRIKNNLQGVVGLLRQHTEDNQELAELIEVIVSRIQSIAIIHGIQAKTLSEEVNLDELLRCIINSCDQTIDYMADFERPPFLNRDEAVPIALILNELITNALKHRSPDGVVRVSLSQGECVVVEITNPFEVSQAGAAKGQGLELVNALIPRNAVDLVFTCTNGIYRVVLSLASPVIV